MKHFVFGFIFGLACVSWAVTPHEDGAVTFDRDEMAAIRLHFANMKAIIENCTMRADSLQQENERLKHEAK